MHLNLTNPMVPNLANVFYRVGSQRKFRKELTRRKWLFYQILTFSPPLPPENFLAISLPTYPQINPQLLEMVMIKIKIDVNVMTVCNICNVLT